ncbi:hypothetical protein FHX57_002012 [Paraburkholderia tropica]|uniref:hypothetical protein n=1 Tax=Paraburkholderia tropica TaxID=92647 RepID=UPI0016092A95|nr:hypothetical protein [Paraburkholderia tropica]MBB2999681.1 hypothetical protein [Paraburkholderia tropica]
MNKRSKPFRHNTLRAIPSTGELRIDWSKYGRTAPRRMPTIQINYQERDGQIFCVAEFPIEQHASAAQQIARQAVFWHGEDNNDAQH